MRKADFEAIARALNGAAVPFILVGGIAVAEHGYGRATMHVDLVIRLTENNVLAAFSALAAIGYRPRVPLTAAQFADSSTRQRLVTEKRMQVLSFWSDERRDTPLDLFVTEPFDFDEEHQTADVREVSPAVLVRVVRLQTLLRMKRAAGRPRDLADIDELSLLHGLPSSYDPRE